MFLDAVRGVRERLWTKTPIRPHLSRVLEAETLVCHHHLGYELPTNDQRF